MRQRLYNLQLGTRLGLGFGLIIFLVLVLGFTFFLTVWQERIAFERLLTSDQIMLLGERMKQEVLEMQKAEKNFLLRHESQGFSGAYGNYVVVNQGHSRTLLALIDEAEKSIQAADGGGHENNLPLLTSLVTYVEAYQTIFQALVDNIQKRGDQRLGVMGVTIESFDNLEAAITRTGNNELRIASGAVQQSLQTYFRFGLTTTGYGYEELLTQRYIGEVRESLKNLESSVRANELDEADVAEIEALIAVARVQFDELLVLDELIAKQELELGANAAGATRLANAIIDEEDEIQNQARATFQEMERIAFVANSLILAFVLVLSILLAVIFTQSITRPLSDLTTVAARMADGEIDQTVEVTSNDEIGQLALTFNLLTGQLRESINTLQEQVAQRTSQLQVRLGELAMLNRVTRLVTTEIDLREALGAVATEIGGVFDVSYSYFVLGTNEYDIDLMASYTAPKLALLNKSLDTGVLIEFVLSSHWWQEKNGQTWCIPDPNQQELVSLPERLQGQGGHSMLVTALLTRGERVGFIILVSTDVNRVFHDSETRLAETIAANMAGAIEMSRLLQEEYRQRQRAESLQDLMAVVSASLDEATVINKVMTQLRQVIHYDSASLLLREGNALRIDAVVGFDEPELVEGVRLAEDEEHPAWQVMQRQKAVILRDARAEPSWKPMTKESALIRGWIGVPLLVGDKSLGVLGIDSHEPDSYREADARLMQAFAHQAAVALENASLYQASQRRAQEMAILSQVGREISATLDLQAVVVQMAEQARQLLAGFSSGVWLREGDTQLYQNWTAAGEYKEVLSEWDIVLNKGVLGSVVARGEAEIVNYSHNDSRSEWVAGDVRADEHIIAAPLMVREHVLGVMAVWRRGENALFTPIELDFLVSLSQQTAVAIENARLFRDMQTAKEAAEAANMAKSTFLATMSHELRTPMNAVIGMTDLVLESDLTDDQRELITIIQNSGEALLGVINNILDFSKIEAGKMDLEKQPFDLRLAIESTLDLLIPRVNDKKLGLAYFMHPQTPEWVIGDVTRLRQILLNLINNAAKFTEVGSIVVEIELAEMIDAETAVIHMSVTDTGIGIPKHKQATVFESFSQVDASTTRRYGGTGLGLPISKRLAELMEGEMWVESVVGEGSTFHFTWQATIVTDKKVKSYLAEGAVGWGQDSRILCLGVDKPHLRVLTYYLQQWGFAPEVVNDVMMAKQIVADWVPDVVIVVEDILPQPWRDWWRSLSVEGDSWPVFMPLVPFGEQFTRVAPGVLPLPLPIKPSQLYRLLEQAFLEVVPTTVPLLATELVLDERWAEHFPLSVLVVDDNETNRRVALRLLQRLGYEPDMATGGMQALEMCDQKAYDLVLMDIQMPDMDGLEATGYIRQEWSMENQPYIAAMTANEDRETYLAGGMDDYISKPIRVEVLGQLLQRANQGQTSMVVGGTYQQDKREAKIDVKDITTVTRFDEKALYRLQASVGDDPSFVVEMIDGFSEEAPAIWAGLYAALADGDIGGVRLGAHSLKGNCAELGGMFLSELCRQIEKLAKDGELRDVPKLLAEAEIAYEAFQQELQIARQTFASML